MIINNNIPALNNYRQMGINQKGAQGAMEKLSSGLRINRAGDDAAGLAISEKMRAQVRGLDQASRNSQDGISMIQTAEGALQETHNILQRMRELATQSSNDTNVDVDREEIQKEMNALTSEINRIGNTTEFNQQRILNGGPGQTGQVRYSVEAQGIAGEAATGELSGINEQTASRALGTGAASGITEHQASTALVAGDTRIDNIQEQTESVTQGTGVASAMTVNEASVVGQAAVGVINGAVETQESIKAGTGEIGNFDPVTGSVKAADAGSIGDFEIGATITETRDNLLIALEDSTGGGAGEFIAGGITYNLTDNDPSYDNGGYADDNLIVFTNAAGDAVDTNAAPMNASAITQVANQAGEYRFEIGTNFEEGQTVEINGYEFTAATAGGNTETQFEIGATEVETAENLRDAIIAAQGGAGAAALGHFDPATVGTGIYNDTITLTETAATGIDLAAVTKTDVTAVEGNYTFELTENFSIGDKITIDGQELTAIDTGGAGNTATTFEVGADNEATASNIVTAIQANGTLDAKFDSARIADQWGNNTLVELTEKTASGNDLIAGDITFDKVIAQKGNYDMQLSTNFVAGETIDIAGQTFTAVESGATAADGEFNVGTGATALDDTTNSLKDALVAVVGPAGTNEYTVTNTNNVLHFEEITATGDAVTKGATSGVGENKGDYEFKLTANFSVGDTIEIGGQTFTAEDADTGSNSATTFKVGDDVNATTENLLLAIQANGILDGRFDTAITNDQIDALTVEKTITFVEKAGQVTGTDLIDPAVVQRSAEDGVYTFEVATNFAVGDTLTINEKTFEAVEDDGVNTNTATQFVVGADEATTAANIKAAIEADNAGAGNLNDAYTVLQSGNSIALTEKSPTGEAADVSFTSGVAEVVGQYEFSLTSNFSVGDTIEVGGETFTAVDADGGTPANGFEVGADQNVTTQNLADAIEANVSLDARFAVTVNEDQVDAFTVNKSIHLEEKTNQATGVDLTDPTVTEITAIEGVYMFDVNTNFAVGDRINIEGEVFTAVAAGEGNTGSTFEVGTDTANTANNIGTALQANAILSGAYDVLTNDNSVALTEKTATGEAVAEPIVVSGTGTAGQFEFAMRSLQAGSTVTIDNTELTIATGGTEDQTAAELKSLIEDNSTLNNKYEVAVDGSNVTLTQKAGQEGADSPTLSYKTEAGAGFAANFQIGANTGQSMTIEVADMRANTLNISSEAGESGQTVTVDNKEFTVNWTQGKSVTNGTDSISTEFALDVSNHDNATAAVKVINDAIEQVSAQRSQLGAFQNRLEHTISNLSNASENMQAAESRVRDTDMAREVMEMTKNNILAQASQAMLAQANQAPQSVLQLLG